MSLADGFRQILFRLGRKVFNRQNHQIGHDKEYIPPTLDLGECGNVIELRAEGER